MTRVLRLGWRFLSVGVINALSLLTAVYIIPGITIVGTPAGVSSVVAFALLIGLINALIRPMLVYLTYPVNLLTVGLPTILIDSLLLGMVGPVWPGFQIDEYWPSAVLGAVVLPASNIILSALADPDRQRTLYDFVLRRLGRRLPDWPSAAAGRGIVFVQIDGLAYNGLRWALRQGAMPALQRLLEGDSHRMLAWDCGIPSQTSSVQAGIMYGENFDIPAFRWFDRQSGRILASNRPEGAKAIDERLGRGRKGLLYDGSSVNNVLTGGARTNIFTVSAIGDADRPSRRIEDLLLFLLNPYCMLRVAGLAVWDLLVENLGAWRQRLRDENPRVSRRGYYPLLRVMTNVVLREMSTYLVLLDIMRGVPAVYVTYLGYDEVAHFAGPASPDVRGPLAGIDHQIRRIMKIIARDAPIPYDVVVLSDHGHTPSVPFSHLAGRKLRELLQEIVSGQAGVSGEIEAEELPGPLLALVEELREAERLTPGRLVPRAIGRGRRALQRSVETERVDQEEALPFEGERDVLVLCSGSVAHLYFERGGQPLTLEEVERRHPMFVTRVAQQPGIGFVAGRSELRGPLVIGARGFRQLETGLVVGEDPLAMLGNPDVIAPQLLRLMRFPNSGDVVIHGAYREGRVVTFEGHIGSHGGLGGAQTQPFLIYPADMSIDPSRVTDAGALYPLFLARRDGSD